MVEVEPPAARARGPRAEATCQFDGRATRTSTCWWWTSRPGSWSTPAPGTAGTLAQALAGRAAGGEDPERAGIVHRLDRDTSGLLVVAKSEEVHAALQEMIRGREIERATTSRWWRAARTPRAGTIDAPLGRDRAPPHRDVHPHRQARARRVTHFEIEEALPRTTLLRVRLETGRTHQIRAHLAAIGHPVVRRPPVRGRGGARLGLTRQFLHADQFDV